MQTRAVTVFTELQQKRGTMAHFTGAGRPQIRSDGRQVRVRIGEAELPARPRIVAAPELSLSASHTMELDNKGHQPLLPGKVMLFREGAFLGTTDIGFVAEGETCSVMMGIADQLKLARTLDHRHSSLTWSGDRKRMQVAFDLSVENLSDAPAQLRLMDRVPVSDNKEIRVSGIGIEPDGKPDSKGLLTWELALAAKEKKTFHISYTLEYPANIAAQAANAYRGALQINGGDINAPAQAPALDSQIQMLEQKF
jgi:uncharacterized protein (TIGR02231 family)